MSARVVFFAWKENPEVEHEGLAVGDGHLDETEVRAMFAKNPLIDHTTVYEHRDGKLVKVST